MERKTKYLDRREAAAYFREVYGIRCSHATLGKMATTGGGPKYVRFGNLALTTEGWMDEWVAGKLSAPRRSTSAAHKPDAAAGCCSS